MNPMPPGSRSAPHANSALSEFIMSVRNAIPRSKSSSHELNPTRAKKLDIIARIPETELLLAAIKLTAVTDSTWSLAGAVVIEMVATLPTVNL